MYESIAQATREIISRPLISDISDIKQVSTEISMWPNMFDIAFVVSEVDPNI
jgi:hypothetical protein